MPDEHLLTPIKAMTIPQDILFVDTETTQTETEDGRIEQHLKLGVAMYYRYRRDGKANRKVVHRFKTTQEYWDWALKWAYPKSVTYMIAHNAVFDFTVLKHMTHLTSLGYECQFVYEGGVRFISKWRHNGNTIMILDNSNWFAGKLERWGDELDLPKLVMPNKDASDEEWFIYCERDTEILYQLFQWYIKFLQDNDLGKWKYTIASSAFTAYRHRYMSHPIYIPNNEWDSDLARASYHGGRTECFKVGKYTDGPYYKLDVNSMYPYVMSKYEYPTKFEGRYKNPPIHKIRPTLMKGCAIADVTVHCKRPYFCTQVNERNVYPIGRFRTVLTTPELLLALDNGWLEEVHDIVIYRKRAIFKEYVDFFYSIKQQAGKEGKRLMRAFAKLYLNSLYGKFGQRGYVDKEIGSDETSALRVYHGFNAQTRQRYTLRQIGHQVLYSERNGEGYNAFTAIASHVTAYARLYLYQSIIKCGRQSVFYCDTDSIITDKYGYMRISEHCDGQRLGAWKLEGTSEQIEIVAPKHYCFNEHWKMKGVSHSAEKLGTNIYRQEIWPGYNSILKNGTEVYYNYFQIKELNPTIISGIVGDDGTIRPFKLAL